MVLVLWGAERFTEGAVRVAARFGLSTFFVGAVVSGFEPENLVTGAAAALGALPQVALGTVIGSAIFMLTGGLGLALLLVPMRVEIPRAGPVAMLVILLLSAWVMVTGGMVGRGEGAVLAAAAIALMVWLYRRSPVFQRATEGDPGGASGTTSAGRALGGLIVGTGVLVLGAEIVVAGARTLVSTAQLSETFLGMVVVGMGESLEETARMVTPARRGHPELAWGNVVGTLVILLGFNLGAIALIRPLAADPFVLRFHTPYLVACAALVAVALLARRRLGRGFGLALLALYGVYLVVNLAHMWR
jgi:cation:H+ antiporter